MNITCFHENCAESGGLLLGKSRICIPGTFKWFIQSQPAGKDAKVHISIYMFNIQVIEIDAHTLTVSMFLKTSWQEYRLKLFTTTDGEKIFLSTDEQKEMWLPEIFIATVSINIQGEEFSVSKIMGRMDPPATLASKNIFLTTRVKCEMEFHDFPFDKHVCNLEVKYR